MGADSFIASRLRFKGKVALWATAISSFVMIVAVSVASGYRKEIRRTVSDVCADIVLSDTSLVRCDSLLMARISHVKGVKSITPAIQRPGVVRSEDILEGVLFKGVPSDAKPLEIRIPEKLSKTLGKGVGDDLLTYFVSERVKVRKFKITEVYPTPVELDRNYIVYCRIEDLQRLEALDPQSADIVEIRLDEKYTGRDDAFTKSGELSYATGKFCTPGARVYRSIFDWLELIDMNVVVILLLMALVAGFNMISGLLIMIMRSTTMIGTLKALGMGNKAISRTFLRVASKATVTGLAIGNAAALLLCLVQGTTHILKLDPVNYFVSFVPVSVNLPAILATDLMAWAVIMLLMLIPSRMISRIDPAKTIKGDVS